MSMQLADELNHMITDSKEQFALIGEEVFIHKYDPAKWSKKEILGHLVDSALNNLLRITQLQYRNEVLIEYDQDRSVAINQYQEMTTTDIINLWHTYNTHLEKLVRKLSPELLDRPFLLNGSSTTARLLIEDYIQHLLHHVKQII